MRPTQEVKYLFRKIPTPELIQSILKNIQFTSIQDPKLFLKTDIPLEKFEECLPELEPYYYPCKAKLFLHNFTEEKAITVLRHMLKTQGYKLHPFEKVNQGIKTTMYQIQREVWKVEDLSGSLHVEFV